MKIKITDSFQVFQRDAPPRDDGESFIVVKDKDSYLVGGFICLGDFHWDKDEGFAFKLYEANQEIYSHKFRDNEYVSGAVYIKLLDSYFLVVNQDIYRKDVDGKPPYLFIPKQKNFELVEDVRAHPSLPATVVLISQCKIRLLSLLKKKFVLSLVRDEGYDRWNQAISFWGSKVCTSLVSMQSKNNLTILSLFRRQETHRCQIVEEQFYSPRYIDYSLCASRDKNFIFVSHDDGRLRQRVFCLKVFEVLEASFKIRASYRLKGTLLDIRFFCQFRENYAFAVLQKVLDDYDFDVVLCQLFAFNSREDSIREVCATRIRLEGPSYCVEILGSDIFHLDAELNLTKVSIHNHNVRGG